MVNQTARQPDSQTDDDDNKEQISDLDVCSVIVVIRENEIEGEKENDLTCK